jgi:hypothetical protein
MQYQRPIKTIASFQALKIQARVILIHLYSTQIHIYLISEEKYREQNDRIPSFMIYFFCISFSSLYLQVNTLSMKATKSLSIN